MVIETNKVLKEYYLMRQHNAICKFSIQISLSSKEQYKYKDIDNYITYLFLWL